jgi:hypothetical protein
MPSAAERDRELARVARSTTAAGAAGALGTGTWSPTPSTPTAATPGTGTSAGTGTGTGTGSGVGSGDGSGDGSGVGSGPAAVFTVSSFNVLGASHTRNGGRGRAPGVVRVQGVVSLLARHDVDVVGFQELQHEQARALLQATGGSYALYPGPTARDSDNSIGWRTSQFRLVRASTVSIPYFNGHHRNMPVVLLRHRASGVQAWFGNFHNPADTHRFHHQQGWRTRATYREAALANRLAATGVPLFITGDMNERADYFCRLTAAAPVMVAARGGSNGGGGCQAGRPRAVDWILGTRGVAFSGYTEDRGPLAHETTDHPVIATRARVEPAVFPRAAP